MPSRFGPGVLPDGDSGFDPDLVVRAIEAFEEGRDRKRRHRREDTQEDLLELEIEDIMRNRGFVPAGQQDPNAEKGAPGGPSAPRTATRTPTPGPDLAQTIRMDTPDFRSRFEPPAGEEAIHRRAPEPGLRGAFDRAASIGPEGMTRPIAVPGQFVPGQGFAAAPIYAMDLDQGPQGPQDPAKGPPPPRERRTIGEREFERRSAPLDEVRRREEASAAKGQMHREIEELISAGVPPELASVAQRDPVLARQLLQRGEDGEGYTAEELQAAGVEEAMIPAAVRDPALARQLISGIAREQQVRSRPDRPSATDRRDARSRVQEEAESFALDLFARGADLRQVVEAVNADPRFRGAFTSSELANVEREARTRFGIDRSESRQPTPAQRERRTGIVRQIGVELTEPWQQQIADRLAGIGPNGQPIQPASPERILEMFEAQGTDPASLERIRDFLSPLLAAR